MLRFTNRRLSLAASATIALFCPMLAEATTYYVSDPGNVAVDTVNKGLLAASAIVFPTIQAAENNPSLMAGDTILVMNGTYRSKPLLWSNAVVLINKPGAPGKYAGSSENYTKFAAYPGHHPIITTAGNLKVLDAIQINAPYISVTGFEVIGNAQSVTLAQATSTALAQHSAYQQSYQQHALTSATPVSYPADVATNGNCIAINRVTHVTIGNNIVHDCSASGISAETSDYLMISHNAVFNTSWWTVYDTSGINIHGAMNSDKYTGYKVYVVNNISHDNGNSVPYYNYNVGNGIPTDGNGIIIDVNQSTNDGQPYLGRTLVQGNIVYNNGGTGIHSVRSSHIDMLNNTAYMNNKCPIAGSDCGNLNEGQIFANTSSDVNIYNNLMYGPAGRYVYSNWGNTNLFESNNLIYHPDNSPVAKSYVILSKTDALSDPQLKKAAMIDGSSFSPDAAAYAAKSPADSILSLRLNAASPARNAGVKRTGTALADAAGYDGNADTGIDIGALSAR